MAPVLSVTKPDRTTGIPVTITFNKELTSSFLSQMRKLDIDVLRSPRTQVPDETIPQQDLTGQVKAQEDTLRKPKSSLGTESFVHSQEALFVATHREEIDGYVKKIIEDKAYVVFETQGGTLERVVKLLKLKTIHADRQGALIRLVVEERGASMNVKFENLEEKEIATWRDKIKDEDLEKYDLLRKFAIPPKPSKLQ